MCSFTTWSTFGKKRHQQLFVSNHSLFLVLFSIELDPLGRNRGLIECMVRVLLSGIISPSCRRQGVESLSMSRKVCVAWGDVFSSFLLVLVYSPSDSEGFCWLLHFVLHLFPCYLFMNIKTIFMLLSIQVKTENLPFHVTLRGLASSKIKKEEKVVCISTSLWQLHSIIASLSSF